MKKGFTIIELIIVISIIALLATLGLSTYTSVQEDARNSKRKADLKELQKSLEIYKQENGAYPDTRTAGGTREWYGLCNPNPWGPDDLDIEGPNAYIPGLTPDYIDRLPADPRDNLANSSSIRPGCSTNANSNCYLYMSDGVNYKLLAHCTPEGQLTEEDPFFDPCRPTYSWQVSSSAIARGTFSGNMNCTPGVNCCTSGW